MKGATRRGPFVRELNPASRWREDTEIEGLTLFDMHREARVVARDHDGLREALADRINEDLQCPICLSIMHRPVIVMECLHRFCTDCIQKCLRTGSLKNECPCCKVHIPSRRSLRDDHNFEALIAKLYPALSEYKSKDERFTELATRELMNAGYGRAAQQGLEMQRQQRSRYKKRADPASRSAASPRGPRGAVGASSGEASRKRGRNPETSRDLNILPPSKARRPMVADELVAFVLRRHPNESAVLGLEREYLRSSSRLLVRHLKTYLGKKLAYRESDAFEIIVRSGNRAVVIDESFSLFDICQHFWQRSSELVLHFRLMPTR